MKILERLSLFNYYLQDAGLFGKDIDMSYIDPKIKPQFETLSVDLKNAILERDVQLYTLNDLIRELENIVNEA